jgi:hypothetical protein
LNNDCASKANEWAERQKSAADELTALAKGEKKELQIITEDEEESLIIIDILHGEIFDLWQRVRGNCSLNDILTIDILGGEIFDDSVK